MMMDGKTKTLANAFVDEQARLRELLDVYKSIPTGAFGAMHIESTLREADAAMASGDVVAILRAYEAMRGCQ